MPQTILVVDDEPEITKLVRAYLEGAGYRVLMAKDGREALLVARHEKPDLIILDLTMPEMDGLEFTRRLRQEKNTPIIMLTARVDETDRLIGLELGADDYVQTLQPPRDRGPRAGGAAPRPARARNCPSFASGRFVARPRRAQRQRRRKLGGADAHRV